MLRQRRSRRSNIIAEKAWGVVYADKKQRHRERRMFAPAKLM